MSEQTVCVVGLGLMGGSLGLALKRRGGVRVHAFARRSDTRTLAVEMGAADAVFGDIHDAVKGACLVVFCTPVRCIPDLLSSVKGDLKPGCVVTDVGSTKAELASSISELLIDGSVEYVGSHPICGSEQAGLESSIATLYDGAVTVVTGDASEAQSCVIDMWESIGSTVRCLTADEHDQALSLTSHLPHVLASLLVDVVAGNSADLGPVCGSGFRDVSRLASGPVDVWTDILLSNSDAVSGSLRSFRERLDGVLTAIEAGDSETVQTFLAAARKARPDLLGAEDE